MTPGKAMAQCGHATLGAYRRLARKHDKASTALLRNWSYKGQAKVALRLDSQEQLYVSHLLIWICCGAKFDPYGTFGVCVCVCVCVLPESNCNKLPQQPTSTTMLCMYLVALPPLVDC
jgi:hypothetical protein